MTARRFPRRPGPSSNPFDGPANPFADEQPRSASPADSTNAFATSAEAGPRPNGQDYQQTLPHRSGLVFWMGAVAAGCAVVSGLMAGAILAFWSWLEVMSYCLPTSFLALVFAIPACVLGQADLRAMRAGAMDERGFKRTRVGFWLGIAGAAIGTLPTLGGLAALVVAALG